MAKILCEFDGIQVRCKVTENMGFQGGDYVKAVEHEGKERIVVKRGNVWRPKTVSERCGVARSAEWM
jgi:hypothetical protein